MRLSQYVQEYLDTRGLSQRDLAKLCDLSPQTISNVIHEKGGVDNSTYAKLASGMNRPMWKLMAIGGVAYIDVEENTDFDLQRFAEDEDDIYLANLMRSLSKADKARAIAVLKVMFPEKGAE